MYQVILLLISIITYSILGFLVYNNNPKSATNKLFGLLSINIVVWSIVNYFSLHPVIIDQIYWIRMVLFTAAPLSLFIYLTFSVFPDITFGKFTFRRRFAVISTVFVMLLTLSSFVFSGLAYEDGDAKPIPGPGMAIFAITQVCLVGSGVWNLITKYRKSKGELREQLRFLVFGLVLTFSLIFITNILFVVIFDNTSFISLASAYMLIFNTALAYSIIKHKLFDIRVTVARGMVYVLTISSLVILYSIFVFSIAYLFFDDKNIDTTVQLVYLTVVLLLAISYQNIKKFFDKVSNRVFYRDAYEPQDVINQINSTLVNTLDLEKLLAATSEIIEKELKVTYADFYLEPKASIEFHLAGSNPKLFASPHWRVLENNFDKSILKSVFANNEQTPPNILKNMQDLHIEGVFKMTSGGDEVGYMLIGERKSGNGFSTQDKQLLEIIANEVAIAVQNALRFEEISQFTVTLQKRIDDATLELQRSNEKLKALDEAKDEFISMASHQLRTPLTSVKGYVSMVLEGDAGDINEQQRTFLDQAMLSSQRMVYLIADLLNVSRLKTGKFALESKPTYLPDVVESEISQLYETAKGRELTLKFTKPETFPTINLDETKIRQVIMNFVDNAIYYTPKGGKINVSLKATPKSIEFVVKDTGIGVPKQDQHKLFSKFYRAGNARKARPDGTGLGLFMAKKVVIAQGGAIIFDTEENKGSTFGFTFPRTQ